MSAVDSSTVGFFGKVPALGDFVSRRLPRQFIEPWDQWMQASMRASQEMLGDSWMSLFLVSPIWRFALSPGICGTSAWAGVVMPSVDRVGRYYPLTLAQAIDKDVIARLFLPDSDWFSRLEEAALSVLSEPFDLDNFDQHLLNLVVADNVSPRQFQVQNGQVLNSSTTKQVYRFDLDNLNQAGLLFPQLTQNLLDRFLPCYSLWATHGAQHSRPSFLCVENLPPVDTYADFLKGAPQYSNNWYCHIFQKQTDHQPVIANSQPVINSPFPKLIPDPDPDDEPLPVLQTTEAKSAEPIVDPAWTSHGITVVGNKRKHNEDAMLVNPALGLWVVADGMGGHQSGDVASRLLVDSLAEMQDADNLSAQIEWICGRLKKINEDLCRYAMGLLQGSVVGTTVVALLAKRNECAAIWAGDSRLYQFRNGQFKQITRDHTLLDELMDSGLMSREDAMQQVGANVITRAVGGQASLELDVLRFDAERGDRYLLCSDGLDKELSETDMSEWMSAETCQLAAEGLINTALSRSGRDNITVIVICFS